MGTVCDVARWSGSIALGQRSDGESEFAEGRWKSMFGVGAELVVVAVEVLDEGVPSADYPGRAESFQAAHRS
jgi:hypothetical protein